LCMRGDAGRCKAAAQRTSFARGTTSRNEDNVIDRVITKS
jgi:hypothetical protein